MWFSLLVKAVSSNSDKPFFHASSIPMKGKEITRLRCKYGFIHSHGMSVESLKKNVTN